MVVRTPKNLGMLIRAARLQKGWLQSDLARHVGSTQKRVSFVEHGKPGTSIDIILRMLSALQVVLDARLSDAAPSTTKSNLASLVNKVADRQSKHGTS